MDPLLAGDSESPAVREGGRRRVDADGNVIGLSGLSEAMRREVQGEQQPHVAAGEQPAPPPQAKLATANPQQARQVARDNARQRSARSVYILAGAMLVVLAIMGTAIWYASSQGNGGSGIQQRLGEVVARDTDSQSPNGSDVVELDTRVPVVRAQWLQPQPWQMTVGLFEPELQTRFPVILSRTEVQVDPEGNQFLVGQLTSKGPSVIIDAQLYLTLVDEMGISLASTQLPIAIVSQQLPQQVRLPLPSEFDAQSLRVVSRVQVTDQVPAAVLVEDLVVEQIGGGSRPSLRIIAFNPTYRPMFNMWFLFTAVDAQGNIVARWKANWSRTVESRQRVEFQVILPLPEGVHVDRWRVLAVGE